MSLVYIVTAHRHGSLESHNYCCGAFTTKQQAENAAKREMRWRGGKYDCMIHEMDMDFAYVQNNKNMENHEWVKPDYNPEIESESNYDESF